MRILIVRHAEPDYVHDALTEKGKREALLLGERLAKIPASAYYVSPLGRAQATADYTLRLVGKQAETLPWLSEFRGYTVQNGKKRIPCSLQTLNMHGQLRLHNLFRGILFLSDIQSRGINHFQPAAL